MSLSFGEIKDLIGKPGVKLEVRSQFGNVMGVGELVGVLEQPSVVIRDEDGTQHHHAASQTYHLVEPPLPEEPDVRAVELGGRVWTREGWPGEHHWESKGFHGASWLALNQLASGVPIVPLVPDPVAAAPKLPFRETYGEVQANTPGYDMHHPVRIAIERSFYSADDAERVGLAILRAAREARAAS